MDAPHGSESMQPFSRPELHGAIHDDSAILHLDPLLERKFAERIFAQVPEIPSDDRYFRRPAVPCDCEEPTHARAIRTQQPSTQPLNCRQRSAWSLPNCALTATCAGLTSWSAIACIKLHATLDARADCVVRRLFCVLVSNDQERY